MQLIYPLCKFSNIVIKLLLTIMGNVSSKTTDFVTILYITFIYDSVGKLLLSTKKNQTALNLKSDRKENISHL